ncbi:RsfA family transcriptional regulator [Texcoconibacillus texcoconensis]|uniref:Prespore-specific regulator n=1 Tax=Texcoconibacillus texcoconensis TaxID=1095777 RepID=A0A840QPB3_9BACI|nr:RsfA family transcriptional regulator [Texcoconibacillus texcoconensis]MBB5173188.1 prespore-specific regulator [Texcoconibacillus texcoconensis]
MTKVRQDAWSHEDDLLLAETVLRHIREGGTQLKAFDEVGDRLNRTSAACGFRWNAVVRNNYDEAVKLAKKQRKENKRRQAEEAKPDVYMNKQQSNGLFSSHFEQPSFEYTAESTTPTQAMPSQQPTFENQTNSQSQPHIQHHDKHSIDLHDVIDYLKHLAKNEQSTQQVERLQAENEQLTSQIEDMKRNIQQLEKDYKILEADYQSMLHIMNRARRLALTEDAEEHEVHTPAFRMDQNGNLEKVAK